MVAVRWILLVLYFVHEQWRAVQPVTDTCVTSTPCLNGGSCTNVNTQPFYKCVCQQYYAGDRCETAVLTVQARDTFTVFTDAKFMATTAVSFDTAVNSSLRTLAITVTSQNNTLPFYLSVASPYIDTLDASLWRCTRTFELDWASLDFNTSNWNVARSLKAVGTLSIWDSGADSGTIYCRGYTGCSNCVNGDCHNINKTSYVCSCKTGYTGRNCDQRIDFCSSSPCINGATCVNLMTFFKCVCTSRYNGTLCNQDINECSWNNCSDHGQCDNSPGSYTCLCSKGYTGVDCQTEINACRSSPCLNGGSCSSVVGYFMCNCPSKYQGNQCETEVNPCNAKPCKNNGNCTTTSVTNYVCACTTNYKGPTCSDVLSCVSNPCGNGGTCTDTVSGYTCSIIGLSSTDTTGTGLQATTEVIRPCDRSPCLNGGSCSNNGNWSFVCQCASGFTGRLCDGQGVKDACGSAPCLNGNSCTNIVNGYKCTCKDTYTGTQCQTSSLVITCLDNNCNSSYKAFQQDISYQVVCSGISCSGGLNNIVWVLLNTPSLSEVDTQFIAQSGHNLPYFTLLRESLEFKTYTLQVSAVAVPSGNQLKSATLFTIVQPPQGGTCTVTPASGWTFKTLFSFQCVNWKSQSQSLEYEVRISPYNDESSRVLSRSTNSNYSQQLEQGQLEFRHQMKVIFRVHDIWGSYTETTSIVNVTTDASQATNFLNTLANSDASLQAALMSKDYSTVTQQLVMASATVSDASIAINNNTRTQVRNTIMKTLSDLPLTDTNQIQATASVLKNLFEEKTSVDVSEMGPAATLLDKASDAFLAQQGNLLKSEKGQAASDFLDSLMTVTTTATHKHDQMKDQHTDKRVQLEDNMKSLVMSVNKILDGIRGNMIMSDVPVTIGTTNLYVVQGKFRLSQLSSSGLNGPYGAVKVMTNSKYISDTNANDCVDAKTAVFGINPYKWGLSQMSSSSSVASIVMNDCGNQRNRKKRSVAQNLQATGVSFGATLAYTSNAQTGPGQTVVVTNISDPSQLVYHTLALSNTDPVEVSVYPYTIHKTLDIFIRYNEKPTRDNFTLSFQAPRIGVYGPQKYSFFIGNDLLTTNKVIQVNVGVGLSTTQFVAAGADTYVINYNYTLAQHSCNIWDTSSQTWTSTDLCNIQDISSGSVTVTLKKPGSFASHIFIAPNKLEYQEVFHDFTSKLENNPLVFITLNVALTVYLILLFFSRLEDQKDHSKWEILSLLDNPENGKFEYEIHVHTSPSPGSETTCPVAFEIIGDANSTGERTLASFEYQKFPADSVFGFHMTTADALGQLQNFKVGLKGALDGENSWKLSLVVVIDLQDKKWYIFACHEWLISTADRYQKVLAAIDENTHQKIYKRLFRTNFTFKLMHMHKLVSLFTAKVRSTFTRVQRLSCLAVATMLPMLISAMWFNTNLSGPYFYVNTTKVYFRTLITSLYCVLITTPTTYILARVFRRCRISPSEEKKHYISYAPIPTTKQKANLPYWCAYIAHALSMAIVVSAISVCIVYSLAWGFDTSVRWLFTVIFSLIKGVFAIDPLVVLIICTVITYVHKKDASFDFYRDLYGEPGIQQKSQSQSGKGRDDLFLLTA